MLESQNRYLDISREYMGKAREYLAANDYKQASEKGWGATAEMVKAVAEERGWFHGSHRVLYRIINDLANETGDAELTRLFMLASDLHTNFYEDWYQPGMVRQAVGDVQELLNRLEPLLARR